MRTPQKHLARVEFITLMAMMAASVAFLIDAMLPALPDMAIDLAADETNHVQLVITSFVLGMGIGTFFAGPLLDAFGRRPIVLSGALVCGVASAASVEVERLDVLLILRFIAGLGAASPRVAVMAIIRDRFVGRNMAQIVSIVIMVFTLVPAIAPFIGQGIANVFGWRHIFTAFVLFTLFYAVWFGLRQPETLAHNHRRPLNWSNLIEAFWEVITTRTTCVAILTLGCAFGMIFATLSSIQQIYDITFGRGDSFPQWWALVTLLAAAAPVLNARFVMVFGMQKIVTGAMAAHLALSVGGIGLWYISAGNVDVFFWAFLVWQCSVFSVGGLAIGNLNALALQPLGHIAGMAASTTTALATVLAVVIAVPIGLTFDGTPVPLMIGVALSAAIALVLMLSLPRKTAIA